MSFTSSIESAATQDVPERQRIEYWEAFNASQLTGVRCSSHDPDGLNVTVRRREHRSLSVSLIDGNQHIVERTPEIARRQTKDSVFACLLLHGSAFFYQQGRCLNLQTGDLLLYDAEQPFLYGFTGAMRQLLIDIPRASLQEASRALRLTAPLRVDSRIGAGRTVAGAIRRAGQRLICDPNPVDEDLVSHLVQSVARPEHIANRTYILPLAEAKNLVEEQLGSAELGPESLSAQLKISVRHLGRLFAAEGTTPSEYIRNRRLDRAYRDLTTAPGGGVTIGEIAYRCGFTDLAHFTRAFRRKFDATPGDVRTLARLGRPC